MGYAWWASSSMAVTSLAGTLQLSVSSSLIDSGRQRQIIGLRTNPQVPAGYPHKSYWSGCRVARLPPGPSRLWLSMSISLSLTTDCALLQSRTGAGKRSTMYSRWMLVVGVCSHWLLVYFHSW
jgi:hypothetical protein